MGLADDPVSKGQQVGVSLLTVFGFAALDYYMRTPPVNGIILGHLSGRSKAWARRPNIYTQLLRVRKQSDRDGTQGE